MRSLRPIHTLITAFILTIVFHSRSIAVELRYTWMLPKTVIDTTIAYTFDDCTDNKLKLKITPTLASRAIPDPLVHVKVSPLSLESFWQDGNITVQTFANSHILGSIGSNPVSQVGQIAGNILGGIAKLVGVALGVPPVAVVFAKNPPPPPAVAVECWKAGQDPTPDSAQAIANKIKDLKAKIITYQTQLSGGVDEATQKKYAAAIQAAQTLIATFQDQITITVKTTIDPGISPIDVNSDNDAAASPSPGSQTAVQEDGHIARICPSKAQIAQAKWFYNVDQLYKDSRPHCAAIPTFEVNAYMDFPNGKGTMFDVDGLPFQHNGAYPQTVVPSGDLYRDVGYIPVLVWRGTKQAVTPQQFDKDDPPNGPVQLIAPQKMSFGQFGVSQTLPLTADLFKNLNWQITFLETGDITASSFTSKAGGVNATTLLGTAVSAANSIATEQRNATSPSNQATALQGQADTIYQAQRLALCQMTPTSCPSK